MNTTKPDAETAAHVLLRATDRHLWQAKALSEALFALSEDGAEMSADTLGALSAPLVEHVAQLGKAIAGARALLAEEAKP